MPITIVQDVIAQMQGQPPADPESGLPARRGSNPPMSAVDQELTQLAETLRVNIRVVGCGGGGSNTINRCTDEGIQGAEMCAINTDAKHLLMVHASRKILIGVRSTKGLGAGALPVVGEGAARENEQEIRDFLKGAHMVFVTAGLGGGTGTGSAHLVARLAKEEGALTIGVVTLPFSGEGAARMEEARDGLERLRRLCDTTVVIQNDKLLEIVPRMPLEAAFKLADAVLMTAIKGIVEIVTKPGLVNLDYSDIETIMKDGGVALIGLGESEGTTDRVSEAVTQALTSPLLGAVSLQDASGALVRIVGGPTMTVAEAEKAAALVEGKVAKRARIIWGCSIDNTAEMQNSVRVLLIITGVRSASLLGQTGGYASSSSEEEIDFVH